MSQHLEGAFAARRVKKHARHLPPPRHFFVADPQVVPAPADTGLKQSTSGAQP